jgi:DNA polymerase III epsilon subunit-like protein
MNKKVDKKKDKKKNNVMKNNKAMDKKKDKVKKVGKNKKKTYLFFLNIETNGLPSKKIHGGYYPPNNTQKYDSSRIIAMSWAIYDMKGNQRALKRYYIKPDPSDKFEVTNSFIHNISIEMLNDHGVPISDIINDMKNDIERCTFLVGHSIKFSSNILKSEIFRLGCHDKLLKCIDGMKTTCVLDQSANVVKIPLKSTYGPSKFKTPKLTELYKFCFKENLPNHHLPEHDVMNVAKCFFHLLNL